MKKTFGLILMVAVLAASLLMTRPVSSQETIPVTITDLGLSDGIAADVNESGQVTGRYGDYFNGEYEIHAYIWTTTEGLNDLGSGEAYSINDLGQVVGDYQLESSIPYSTNIHATLWTDGIQQDIHTLVTWRDSIAYDINNYGQVVGCMLKDPCYGFDCWSRAWDGAFIWTEETGMQDLSALTGETLTCAYDINENGQIVGDSESGPFVWSETNGIQYITDNSEDHAYSINDAGQVAGMLSGNDIYVWSNNVMNLLGISASGSEYVLINDLGQVTGSTSVDGETRAFLWDLDLEINLLYLPHLDIEFPMSYGARSNNSGQVAGASNGYPVLWTIELPPPVPQEQIALIATKVDVLVTAGTLEQGEGTALIAKLDAATLQLNKENFKATSNILGAFINTVEAFVNSDRLTPAQAQPLIDATNVVIDSLPQ